MAFATQGGALLKSGLEPSFFSSPIRLPAAKISHSCIRCTRAALAEKGAITKSDSWTWKCDGKSLKINFVTQSSSRDSGKNQKNLLFLPTISDVSTTEEWQAVADEISSWNSSWRSVIVDWPGFGLSDRPPLNYTADIMEKFLVEFISSSDGPLGDSSAPMIAGVGHAATLAARAISRGRIEASSLVAVAPTWAGPLPIVFGQSPEAESRYGLLRSALRAPGVGWALYNALVSSPGNIRKQYESHVYSETKNVTESIVDSRLALTKRDGARYAPAAFLTGLLDPVKSREEFVRLFEDLEGKSQVLVLFSTGSPRRSRAEMEALRGVRGVTRFVEIPGALLAQEEFPAVVTRELKEFLA